MVREIKEGRSYSFSFENRNEKLHLLARCPSIIWFIDNILKVERVYQTFDEETFIIRADKRPSFIVPKLIMKYMNIVPEYIQEQLDV